MSPDDTSAEFQRRVDQLRAVIERCLEMNHVFPLPDDFRDPDAPLSEDQLLMRKKVLHQIESEPETFHMTEWECTDEDWAEYRGEPVHMCRTTRCVAGWAQYFERGYVDDNVEPEAVRLLGLTTREYYGDGSLATRYGNLFNESEEGALYRLRKLAEG